MRTTLKDVVKGGVIERRFNIGENWKMYVWNVVRTNILTVKANISIS